MMESSKAALSLHAELLIVAASGRDLVFQDRTRRDRSRRIHLRERLARKLMRYIEHYNNNAKPIKWPCLRSFAQDPQFRFAGYRQLGRRDVERPEAGDDAC
jgi:hypothetical protein